MRETDGTREAGGTQETDGTREADGTREVDWMEREKVERKRPIGDSQKRISFPLTIDRAHVPGGTCGPESPARPSQGVSCRGVPTH